MAGEYWNSNVWISANGGDTFIVAIKPPTGAGQTQVLMAPGAFDPAEGVAYAATRGAESAFNYTNDGGDTWNQPAFVDTDITNVLDLAFGSTVLITDGGPDSVWRINDITAATPMWERVYSTPISDMTSFGLAEYSIDGSVLMLYGTGSSNVIEKSTDNGQIWTSWRTLPSAIGAINDWVVYDSATIFAACANGFYGTTRFGPAKQRLNSPATNLVSIALQPGFNPSDADNSKIIVGSNSDDVYISLDAGNIWGAANDVGTGSVYVAFDQLDSSTIYFATSASTVGTAKINTATKKFTTASMKDLKDSATGTATANSFSGIWVSSDNALYVVGGDAVVTTTTYAAPKTVLTNTITLTQGETTDTVTLPVTDITVLTGSFTEGTESLTISGAVVIALSSTVVQGTVYVTGVTSGATGSFDILVAAGLAGYDADPNENDVDVTVGTLQSVKAATSTSTTEDADLFRLLLGETGNIWETEQKVGAVGLWGFNGSNNLLTVVDSHHLWGLKDTLSGKVQGVTVSSIGENKATVSWTAMTGAKQYIVKYDSATVLVPSTPSSTPATTVNLTGLTDDKTYTVKVRVETDHDFQSRWSTGVSFTTIEAIAQPENLVPVNGMQDAPLLPSFVWTEVSNAVEYEFQLSTDPAFGTTLVDITTVITAYTLQTELAYDTNHYWRVRAVSDTGTKSTWCFSNFHTRTEAIPPVTVEPQPTPTVILPTPQVQVTVVPPDVDITLPAPQVTVIPPDITVDVPDVVTVTQQAQPTLVLPVADDPGTPVYIWVIVGIGAILTIAVIVLIIRTRRVV